MIQKWTSLSPLQMISSPLKVKNINGIWLQMCPFQANCVSEMESKWAGFWKLHFTVNIQLIKWQLFLLTSFRYHWGCYSVLHLLPVPSQVSSRRWCDNMLIAIYLSSLRKLFKPSMSLWTGTMGVLSSCATFDFVLLSASRDILWYLEYSLCQCCLVTIFRKHFLRFFWITRI